MRHKISEDQRKEFTNLWNGGTATTAMSEHFECRSDTIVSTAIRFGLEMRSPYQAARSKRYRKDRHEEREEKPATMELPEQRPSGSEFWTEAKDLQILAAQGKWAKLTALADKWGCTSREITARWHKLRVLA